MDKNKGIAIEHEEGLLGLSTPPIVSPEEWEAARQLLLVKEKELTRARDALAAERRRMPWVAVEKAYEFQGPEAASLPILRRPRQLILPASSRPASRAGQNAASAAPVRPGRPPRQHEPP